MVHPGVQRTGNQACPFKLQQQPVLKMAGKHSTQENLMNFKITMLFLALAAILMVAGCNETDTQAKAGDAASSMEAIPASTDTEVAPPAENPCADKAPAEACAECAASTDGTMCATCAAKKAGEGCGNCAEGECACTGEKTACADCAAITDGTKCAACTEKAGKACTSCPEGECKCEGKACTSCPEGECKCEGKEGSDKTADACPEGCKCPDCAVA
jgi:hypothetical protein